MDCPLHDSQLRVHYKGMLLNEEKTVFYDTKVDNNGQPLEFSSGEGLVSSLLLKESIFCWLYTFSSCNAPNSRWFGSPSTNYLFLYTLGRFFSWCPSCYLKVLIVHFLIHGLIWLLFSLFCPFLLPIMSTLSTDGARNFTGSGWGSKLVLLIF